MEKSEKSFIKVDVNIDGEVCNNKLMDKIAGVTGIIFGPYREKKLARTKFLQEINGREDLTNIEKLAIKSNYKKILKEYENQNDIVNKAIEMLNKPIEQCEIDLMDDTWIMTFIDNAKNICDDELKLVWSKILAGELENNGTYSLRTLERVKNMSKKDAEKFTKIADFIMESGNRYFLLNDDEVLEKYNITYEDIMFLDEIGFIKEDGKSLNASVNKLQIIYNNIIVFIEGKKEKLSLPIYTLTEVGKEVFSLLQTAQANLEYLKCFSEKNKEKFRMAYSEIIRIEGSKVIYKSDLNKLYNENE